jgi:hypothetical protein
VICNCGHEGILTCSESDSAFGSNWESYALTGFNGGKTTGIDPGSMTYAEVFASLGATCPNCNANITNLSP